MGVYSTPTGLRLLAWQNHAGSHVRLWELNIQLCVIAARRAALAELCFWLHKNLPLKTNASGRGECCESEGDINCGFGRLLRTGFVTSDFHTHMCRGV